MPNYVLALVKDKEKLRNRADEVVLNMIEKPRVVKLINDIEDTLKADVNLVALSAPQLGHAERIFSIKFANGDVRTFINPVIVRSEGMHLSREISIGLDSTEYIIPRCDDIFVTYQTPSMTDQCDLNKFTGVVSEVFQQMNDILNGVLLEDIGLEVLKGWDKATEEERQEIIAMYLDTLEKRKLISEEVVNQHPETKDLNKAIEFMTKLQLGEIETMPLTEEELKEIEENTRKKEAKK